GFKVENRATISVWRCVGPADGGKATLVSLWRTEDSCKTWKQIEQKIVYPEEEKQLGFLNTLVGGGSMANPLLNEDEIPLTTINPFTSYGADPRLIGRNGDKIFLTMTYSPFDDNLPNNQKPYSVHRMFLSTDNGKSWKALSWPSHWAKLDRYPETPELTLLASGPNFPEGRDPHETDFVWGWPDTTVRIDIVSAEDGTINLFMVSSGYNGFIKGTIKSPTP
ncbi:MAG: hypothetical protein PHE52_01385, partial [Candidatus Pacebacteria bacterium]|nr:hypothetical protein [Candidatus Paceibacterota bacterium]